MPFFCRNREPTLHHIGIESRKSHRRRQRSPLSTVSLRKASEKEIPISAEQRDSESFFAADRGSSAEKMAETTATPSIPVFLRRGIFPSVIPPMATVGESETELQIRRSSSEDMDTVSFFVDVEKTAPIPRVIRRRPPPLPRLLPDYEAEIPIILSGPSIRRTSCTVAVSLSYTYAVCARTSKRYPAGR